MFKFFFILNLEGHPNRITGSKVMVSLLNEWILPIGGDVQQACSLQYSSKTMIIFNSVFCWLV